MKIIRRKQSVPSVPICGYVFQGPFWSADSLENRSGVYAIIDQNNKLIDVGESSDVRDRIENHDRKNCWERRKTSELLGYAVHYTPNQTQEDRQLIEREIRKSYPYPIPCGIW